MYLLALVIVGFWLMTDGAVALLYVNPPPFWATVRVTRILLGIALLIEARRIRVKYFVGRKDLDPKGYVDPLRKVKQGYADLLALAGVCAAVDGIGTGVLGYVYPVLWWQLLRFVRVVIGASLVLGGHYFVSRLRLP